MQPIKILIATLSLAATAGLAQPPAGGPNGAGAPGGFGGRISAVRPPATSSGSPCCSTSIRIRSRKSSV